MSTSPIVTSDHVCPNDHPTDPGNPVPHIFGILLESDLSEELGTRGVDHWQPDSDPPAGFQPHAAPVPDNNDELTVSFGDDSGSVNVETRNERQTHVTTQDTVKE